MKRYIKILILEDLEEDVGLVKRVLRKEGFDFDMLRVDERDEYMNALEQYQPDIILSDHALPQFNSIEALDIRMRLCPKTPFILVTGAVSEEFAALCIKRGANDYILKSNLTRLPVALTNALESKTMEDQRQEDEQSIRLKNRELVKINQEMDSFIYSVSHNLRAPLASVLGLVRLAQLESKEDPAVVARYLTMIEKSIDKLDITIRDILEYSRNARTELDITKVDFDKLLAACLAKLEHYTGFHSIEKRLHIKPQIAFYTDARRLGVILDNLLSNSVKYADLQKPNPFIQISIVTGYPHTTIEFSDNGIGINHEYLPLIYNMFYRATEKSSGAGLGLYIVKELINKLHGTVQVASVDGEGTSFTIKIPNLNPEYTRG